MTSRLTDHDRALRRILEADWQDTVERLARAAGWLVYHAPDNRPVTSARGTRYVQNVRAGFPDLVMVRPGRLVIAELKRETTSTTPEQDGWLDAFRTLSNAEVYVWRPRDLATVRKVLVP